MRPAAQERWVVCYELQHFATSVVGFLDLMLEPECEKVPELAKKAFDNAKRALELVQLLRFSGILEAETPPEVSEGPGWPKISASLRQAARKNESQ